MKSRPSRDCDGMYDSKLAKMQQRFRESGETTPRAGLELGTRIHQGDRRRGIEADEQDRLRSNEDRC